MASLHKTWYKCDSCGTEDDSTKVVHNRFEINRAHFSTDIKEVCDSCAWDIKEAIRIAIEKIRSTPHA